MVNQTRLAPLTANEERLVHALQILGDKTRFKIFKLLISDKELCVSDIAHQLDISVSAVSQHFRNFEMIGLVGKERMGQKICYGLRTDDDFVKQLVKLTSEG